MRHLHAQPCCPCCGWPVKTDMLSRRELVTLLRTGAALPCGCRPSDPEAEKLARELGDERRAA